MLLKNESEQRHDRAAFGHMLLCGASGILAIAGLVFVGSVAHQMDAGSVGLGVVVSVVGLGGFAVINFQVAQKIRASRIQSVRRVSSAIGLMSLLFFPFGTLIGIFILINNDKPWIDERSY